MVSRRHDRVPAVGVVVCGLMVVLGLFLATGIIDLTGFLAFATRNGKQPAGGDVSGAARTLGMVVGWPVAGYGGVCLLGMLLERSEATAPRSVPRSRRVPVRQLGPREQAARRRINLLDEDRSDQVEAIRSEWWSSMLTTARADRPAAERAVGELYRGQGLPMPRIVWTDSPVGGLLALGLLSEGDPPATETLGAAFRDRHWAMIGDSVRDSVRRSLTEAYGDDLGLTSRRRDRLTSGPRTWWNSLSWSALDLFLRQRTGLTEIAHTRARWWTTNPRILGVFPGRPPGAALPAWLRSAVGIGSGVDPTPIAAHDLWRRTGVVHYDGQASRLLDPLVTIARSCSWWSAYPLVCVLSERPVRLTVEWVDREPRLHDAEGPAVEYRDGVTRYAWHGVLVPRNVITGELTGEDWLGERDAEIRRAIAERMGYVWLLDHCRAAKIATDEFGTLWWLPHPEEPVMLVDVVNSTPEPDGSFRRYVLRVPPHQTVPRDAIGWTFGLPPGAYGPIAMT